MQKALPIQTVLLVFLYQNTVKLLSLLLEKNNKKVVDDSLIEFLIFAVYATLAIK